jgi:hypothetical protein
METIAKKYKNKICVITPSIRLKGLPLVQKALEGQTFTDFDWFICSPEEPKDCWATWIPDTFKGGLWSLNRAYNALIKASECDLIVSWQDYTFSPKDALQRFWQHYEYEPKMLISALGDKYKDTTWKEQTWTDLRVGGRCNPNFVEWNLCSCPKKSLVEIGGFDEEADFLYFGLDGYQVNYRLEETGHTFYCDPKIESFSLGHGRVAKWDELNGMGSGKGEPYQKHKADLISRNLWPVIGKL